MIGFLRSLFLISLVMTLASCVEKDRLSKVSAIRGNANITAVSIKNNQLIINGTNLSLATEVQLKSTSLSYDFSIESISPNQIIANAVAAINFSSNTVFDLVLSSAQGASVFPITFTIANNSITASMLTSMGASTGQILKFNGTKWLPSSLTNTQTYMGTWDANDFPTLPAATSAGEYYIVDVAAGVYTVGDWLIFNGLTFDRIPNTAAPAIDKTTIQDVSKLRIYGANTTKYVELSAPTLATNTAIKFPVNNGINGYFLSTDGAGNLSWEAPPVGGGTPVDSSQITDGTIVNADISGTANISQLKIANLTADLAGKEPNIVVSSALKYFRGDKTFVTLDTSVVPENGNLYYTIARVTNDTKAMILSGLSTVTNAAITTTDSLINALGKLQAQITSLDSTKLDKTGGTLSIGTINGVPNPNNSDDVSNKAYVDNYWSTGSTKMIKNSTQPAACSSSNDGSLAVTSLYTTCVCKNGIGWVSTRDGETFCQWADPCPNTPGSICTGGAIFLGTLSPGSTLGSKRDKYMTTPGGCADIPAGQISGGTGTSAWATYDFTTTCSGSDSLVKNWNDGSTNWYDIPSVANGSYYPFYGDFNIATIVTLFQPSEGGPHAAARYCDKLVFGGYSDWYLPNHRELLLMQNNNASIPGLVNQDYWGAMEYSSSNALFMNLITGVNGSNQKNNSLAVRCIRSYRN
jgi:hypothetical protein